MSPVSPTRGAGSGAPLSRPQALLVVIVYVTVVAATQLGVLPGPVAVALAGGCPAAIAAWLLIRHAVAVHALRPADGQCRGAGFMGLGVLSGGLGLAVAGCLAPRYGGYAVTAGFLGAALMFPLGLLLLPGTAPTLAARLRRAVDGLVVGSCLFFTTWLLVVAPMGGGGAGPRGLRVLVVTVVALVCAVILATTIMTGVQAARYRRAAMLCSYGVAASLVGYALLAMLSLVSAADGLQLVAAGLVVVGPLVIWSGARRTGLDTTVQVTAENTGNFSGLPLFTAPIGLAMMAATYHLFTVGTFSGYQAVLGIVVVVAVALRELVTTVDVRRYAARIKEREAHFRSVVAGSHDVTVVLDVDLVVRWQSPSAARQLGLSDQDVLGRSFIALVHPEDTTTVAKCLGEALTGAAQPLLFDARLRDGFGRWRDIRAVVTDQRDVPEVSGLVIHTTDAGERKEFEQMVQRMTFSDALTGLPNRSQVIRLLGELRENAAPGERYAAMLVVDLDRFKAVNDAHGHETGDAVLVEAARRLRASVGPDDTPARLGADEFAVVTTASPLQAQALGTRLATALAAPYHLPLVTVVLTASVGISECGPVTTVDEVLRDADSALRHAKRSGQGRVERYDEALAERSMRRMALEQELAGAVNRGELDVVFQPIVELATRRPVGMEALLRWRHPLLGTVAPGELIPVAEDIGIICEIDEWVLSRGLRLLAGWLSEGRDVWLGVNISARQLRTPSLVTDVADRLAIFGVPPERLLLEISELGLNEEPQRITGPLAGLRALGVRLALDDFGAGQSSLAWLHRLRLDVLKIDRALVAAPPVGDQAGVLAEVAVQLGHRLGMDVLAEGVESETQREALVAAGCRLGQGYLFGRPLPAEHAEAFLDTYTPTD